MKISAYIPCFYARRTIGEAIESIRAQSHPVDEIFVVDNHSADGSAQFVASLGIRVISLHGDMGRGAARARAMGEAAHELVLCCDSAITLDPDFVKNALPWFEDEKVAAVFGWVTQLPPVNAVERWRGRHLFKAEPEEVLYGAKLATGGALLRSSVVAAVGGFRETLRMAEDADLGIRLITAGHDVICDPRLRLISIAHNSLLQVLERYWRWNTVPYGRMSVKAYLRQILYSIKIMAHQDLIDHDATAALISLLCPHYQFWRSMIGYNK